MKENVVVMHDAILRSIFDRNMIRCFLMHFIYEMNMSILLLWLRYDINLFEKHGAWILDVNTNSISFKCHSIRVTFKFYAVLVALCTPEPCSMDSLGTQHCTNFESHSYRVTFETNASSITSSIHAHALSIENWLYHILTKLTTYHGYDRYLTRQICFLSRRQWHDYYPIEEYIALPAKCHVKNLWCMKVIKNPIWSANS